MARPTRSAFDNNPLRRKLAALRRRLRTVVTARGVGWLLAVILLTVAVVGAIDWCWHLPALARAFLLVGLLATAGIVALLELARPLLSRMDDLTLALRVEERYPSLNDALASTVQFLQQAERNAMQGGGSPSKDSPAMRREAARRAMQRAEGCDFNRIIDTRGLRAAGMAGLAGCVVATTLFFLFPSAARTAVTRLADPFGPHAWPSETTLELDPFRSRIGRNEAFRLGGKLSGVIPDRVVVIYRLDGSTAVEHEATVERTGERSGQFGALLRPGQSAQNFTFQVRANDAVSEVFRVEVAPAPALALYQGQASPQVQLFFPAYTGLSPRALPPATGNITDNNVVPGTVVTLHAAANVPLRAAWLEYQPDPLILAPAACMVPLAGADAVSLSVATAAGLDVAGRHPATLSEDRRSFHFRFRPLVSGNYTITFEDDTGLSDHRTYDLQVRPDPSPAVKLERPSALRESLEVMPNATLPLRALVEDPVFGIRSVRLEYRIGSDEPFRRRRLFDPASAGSASASALAGVAPAAFAARARPGHYVVARPLPLSEFRHLDDSPLGEGDVLTLRVAADDYDDVTPDKEPGRSSEVEIRIVSRSAFELALNREQARIQQDMLEIREQQREAARKVAEIENRVARTNRLTLDDQAELARIEQLQQQIRERLEAPAQESLRGRVERVLETLEQNEVTRSATRERLEGVRRELERLGREELRQIEAALTNTRKQAELPEELRDGPAKALEIEAEKAARQAARLEQLAVERPQLCDEANRLREQASRLAELAEETRKDTRTPPEDAVARADARARELEELARQREQLARELARQAESDPAMREREMLQLAEEQKDAAKALLEQARADGQPRDSGDRKAGLTEVRRRQEEVDKTLGELLKRMEPWSSTREVKAEVRALLEEQRRLNETIRELQQRQEEGRVLGADREMLTEEQQAELDNAVAAQQRLRTRMEELTDKMGRLALDREATDPATALELREALNAARQADVPAHMRNAENQLKSNQVVKAGEEQRRTLEELEKLARKMEDRREAELDRLIKQMREEERKLDELAEEQDRLIKKFREAEQITDPKKREEELKKLTRQQQELEEKVREASRRLSRQGAERASQTLNQAADRMGEAVRRLERGEPPAEQQEEALDRLDEALDDVERARDSDEEELAREQLARVADVLRRFKERHDRLVSELARLQKEALEQKGWGRRIISLGDLGENQKALGDEARSLADRELTGAEIFALRLRTAADSMKQAGDEFIRHGDRVIAAGGAILLPEEGERLQKEAQRLLQSLLDALTIEEGARLRPNNGANRPAGQSRPLGDGIPPLAQLKLLRAMQQEVNERTAEFIRMNPEAEKWTEGQKKELDALRREQKAIADMIEDFTRPLAEGGR